MAGADREEPAGAAGGRGIAVLDPVPPALLVLAGATSVQFGAALAATLFDDLGPGGASLLRVGLAAVVLWVMWRPRPGAHPREHVRLAVLFGLVLGGMNLCFYEALDRIPLGVAVTIEFIGPIGLATLLSRRPVDFAWVGLAITGIVLLARPWSAEDALDPVGVALVLAAAVFWALYIVLAQRAGRVFDGGQGLAIAMVAATLVTLPPGVVEAGTALFGPEALALGFTVALLSSVIPYSLETEALRRMPARVFGVLMSLEPALAALAGFLVLGQTLDALGIAAVALVVTASIGVTRTAERTPPPEAVIEA
ncbi:MAG: DMT family transporter [Solirubrobacteraceae bacterium]|nr:DMT family transporter [Solirubrobacteraceae bacterium]